MHIDISSINNLIYILLNIFEREILIMKVRIATLDSLTKKQRDEIDKYIKTRGLEIYQAEAEGNFRRYYKLLAVSLNKKFGFGKKRILEVFEDISELSKERDKDTVFWSHIDKIVIDQLGIKLEKEEYQYLDD